MRLQPAEFASFNYAPLQQRVASAGAHRTRLIFRTPTFHKHILVSLSLSLSLAVSILAKMSLGFSAARRCRRVLLPAFYSLCLECKKRVSGHNGAERALSFFSARRPRTFCSRHTSSRPRSLSLQKMCRLSLSLCAHRVRVPVKMYATRTLGISSRVCDSNSTHLRNSSDFRSTGYICTDGVFNGW